MEVHTFIRYQHITVIIIIFYFQNKHTANSNHNQTARKSHDQQSWLPMITTQMWY